MHFSDFIKMMKKFFNKKLETQPVFLEHFCALFVNWQQAEASGNKELIEDELSKVNDSGTASRIFKGKIPLSSNLADVLFPYFDRSDFLDKFDELTTEDTTDSLAAEIAKYGFPCNADTVRDVIADLYQKFLDKATTSNDAQEKDVVEPSSESTPINTYSSNLFDYNYDFVNAVKEYEASLLLECNRICPNYNCTNNLLYENNGRAITNYEIVKINPKDKPVFKNLIALCPECAKKYRISYDEPVNSTQTRMDCMQEIKEELSAEVMNSNLLTPVKEIDIRAVMLAVNNKLNKITPIPFNYDPVRIEQKIEPQNRLLLYQIKMFVSSYYDLVRETLKNLSDENALTFDLDDFAYAVKIQCKILVKQKLPQPQVFELLVSWLKNLSKSDDTACRVIIAYFVQNCEVFNAISK